MHRSRLSASIGVTLGLAACSCHAGTAPVARLDPVATTSSSLTSVSSVHAFSTGGRPVLLAVSEGRSIRTISDLPDVGIEGVTVLDPGPSLRVANVFVLSVSGGPVALVRFIGGETPGREQVWRVGPASLDTALLVDLTWDSCIPPFAIGNGAAAVVLGRDGSPVGAVFTACIAEIGGGLTYEISDEDAERLAVAPCRDRTCLRLRAVEDEIGPISMAGAIGFTSEPGLDLVVRRVTLLDPHSPRSAATRVACTDMGCSIGDELGDAAWELGQPLSGFSRGPSGVGLAGGTMGPIVFVERDRLHSIPAGAGQLVTGAGAVYLLAPQDRASYRRNAERLDEHGAVVARYELAGWGEEDFSTLPVDGSPAEEPMVLAVAIDGAGGRLYRLPAR